MTEPMRDSSASADTLRSITLDDKYDLAKQDVFLTGTQAVARMLLMQRERDRQAGLDTAGFVSGYRGSPLGGLDQQLMRAAKPLKAANIVFQPGLNEDLAATAIWGTQQAGLSGEGKHDGVFALWYGKGPGVDRSGDVFRHGNMAGTDPKGGVICLMGDDHTAESSTNAHQTEFVLVDRMMPILNPAGVQEIIDYGLHGIALSRFASVWVGIKCVKDNIESTASIDGSLDRVTIVTPGDYVPPPGGLAIRRELDFVEQERRLHLYKRDAMLAYLRANRLNRIVTHGGREPRIGIATVGKSYLDVRQALEDLGIDEVRANDLGIRLFKLACPWPIDPAELKAFAEGLDLIMVVEEKRSLIEVQVREELYGAAHQPMVIGKKDEQGDWLFPVHGALDPNDIAIALGERIVPGSNETSCNRIIDSILAIDSEKNKRDLVQALAAFNGKAAQLHQQQFQQLSAAQQNEILSAASAPDGSLHAEFGIVKEWMADAYWSSREGLRELGSTGRLAWNSLPGCSSNHPHN